jgi:toxin YhaV
MIVNGWTLYALPKFTRQLERLAEQVDALVAKDPNGYMGHPSTKLLITIRQIIREKIPREPNAAEFRQGNTLGVKNRQWFRAKFHQRFRLFFRFSSKEKVIIYAWMNDERTLRKAGAKTDPYRVFREMLEAGDPPRTMEELLTRAGELKD